MQSTIQGLSIYHENFRREGLIALGHIQDIRDITLNHLFKRDQLGGIGGFPEKCATGMVLDLLRQVFGHDLFKKGHNHAVLHGITQLPNIARPLVTEQAFGGRIGESTHLFFQFFSDDADKLLCHEKDIVTTFPQRRNVYFDNIQPVIQVFTETAFGNGGLYIHIGCGENTGIKTFFLVATNRPDTAFFQGSQQFWLQTEGQITNFIEKQRATARLQ